MHQLDTQAQFYKSWETAATTSLAVAGLMANMAARTMDAWYASSARPPYGATFGAGAWAAWPFGPFAAWSTPGFGFPSAALPGRLAAAWWPMLGVMPACESQTRPSASEASTPGRTETGSRPQPVASSYRTASGYASATIIRPFDDRDRN
jgi:hypothetical protein